MALRFALDFYIYIYINAYISGPQTLTRGPNLAQGAFSSGPHNRVNNTKLAQIS